MASLPFLVHDHSPLVYGFFIATVKTQKRRRDAAFFACFELLAYEALSLMISFGLLAVAILSFQLGKPHRKENRAFQSNEESRRLLRIAWPLVFYYTDFSRNVKTRKDCSRRLFRLLVRLFSAILCLARGSRESVFSREGGDAPWQSTKRFPWWFRLVFLSWQSFRFWRNEKDRVRLARSSSNPY